MPNQIKAANFNPISHLTDTAASCDQCQICHWASGCDPMRVSIFDINQPINQTIRATSRDRNHTSNLSACMLDSVTLGDPALKGLCMGQDTNNEREPEKR